MSLITVDLAMAGFSPVTAINIFLFNIKMETEKSLGLMKYFRLVLNKSRESTLSQDQWLNASDIISSSSDSYKWPFLTKKE